MIEELLAKLREIGLIIPDTAAVTDLANAARTLEGMIAKDREGAIAEALREAEAVLSGLTEATWDAAYISGLPDSAFLYIAPGGKKDEADKTVPRALRYFPIYDEAGKIDLPHLRNALARIPQSALAQAVKDKVVVKAQALAKKNLPSYKEAHDPGIREAGVADMSHEDIRRRLSTALKAKMGLGAAVDGPWVRDVFADHLVYDLGGKYFQLDYTMDAKGKAVVGEPFEVVMKTIYEPIASVEAGTEFLDVDVILLDEAAIAKDGTTEVKIIQPGWGSSGYYSPEVLARDAIIYKPGTQMYWDHPTVSEQHERPERSLRDLAGELTGQGVYNPNGQKGPGVYAPVKVFAHFRSALEELAPHIGVSHRVLGKAVAGEADGKKGPIIEKMLASRSVDFVTKPGAGGAIVGLFEAARERAVSEETETPTGEKEEKRIVEEAKRMAEELEELKEAKAKVTELEEAQKTLTDENARLKEAEVMRGAREVVAEKVGASDLPEITKARLIESLAMKPVLKDGGLDVEEFGKVIAEAIVAETAYITGLTGAGKIRGMGSSEAEGGTALKDSFERRFRAQGSSPDEAKALSEAAVNGR